MSKKKRKGSGLAKSQTESSPEDVDAVSDDSPEVDDAATKEMVAYALGGVAGQIANSDMLLKQNLLMFVLQINPMLIAFMGIFGTLWDSITDPIMANISDNFKSRWGRRRPFILVGGLLSTIFSVVIWANFPDSDKTVKNIKEIPEIVQSENALENFGDMLRGYGITQTKLALTLDDSVAVESEKPADHIDALLKHSLKKIGAGISLVEDDSSAIPLTISTEGFGTDRLDDELMGQEFSARLTLGDRVVVDGRVLIEADYPQKRGFRERAGNFFNGRAAYMGLRFDGEQIDYRRNAYQKDGIYRARLALLNKSIIEALGEYYNLPYWKCFPEKGEQGKITLREEVTLGTLATMNPKGLVPADSKIYTPLVDTFLTSVEKRKKYNTLKNAIKTKTIDAETEALLLPFADSPDDLAAIREGLKKGKFSKKIAGLLMRKAIAVTEEDLQTARIMLADSKGEISYSKYVALHTKRLLYGAGYNVDFLQTDLTQKDLAEVQSVMTQENLANPEALYAYLWAQGDEPMEAGRDKYKEGTIGLLKYMQADEVLSRHLNQKFKGEKPSTSEKFKEGLLAFGKNEQDDKVAIYMIVALIIMATFGTIRSVPYYALGIELAPSYNGRTKVIAIRSVMSQIVRFVNPWLFPFVLLPLFSDGINGAMWLGIICGIISIPLLVYSTVIVKERTVLDKKRKKVPFFKSIKQTASVPEFWRVVGLYFFLQKSLGLVMMAGGYLTIYWVFNGGLKVGAYYIAIQQSLGVGMAILAIPLITWLCKKFEKHNALRFAIYLLMLNALLSWVCYNPDRPYLMFILPFVGSIAISSMYTVVSTLMADVTDVDELRNHSRREGMFGAVNAMVMKAVGPIGAIMASLVVLLSGFDIDMGVHQEPGVFTSMRIWLMVLPLVFLSFALLLLHKYPLTRERMLEIKAELKHRHERIAREEALEDAQE